MFRCPACGQAQEMILSPQISMINVNEGCNDHGLHATYMAAQGSLPETWREMNREDEEMFIYAVQASRGDEDIPCDRCEAKAPLSFWMDCWKDPLVSDALETENLCHCGGELWLDPIPNSNQFAFVCDKCGWTKPKTKVSGGQ